MLYMCKESCILDLSAKGKTLAKQLKPKGKNIMNVKVYSGMINVNAKKI